MNRKEEPWEVHTKRRSLIPTILCVILALLVVFLAAVCVYYMRVNGALAQENITLSGDLYDAKQEVKRLEKEIDQLNEPEQQTVGEAVYSYEEWEKLYNAGVISVGYQEYVDALDKRKKFSLDEYFKAKEEWQAASNAGLTDLTFEEWQAAIENSENTSKASGSFYEDYQTGAMNNIPERNP